MTLAVEMGVLVCLPCLVAAASGSPLPPLLRPWSHGRLKLSPLAGDSGVVLFVGPLGPQGWVLGGHQCLCEELGSGDFFPQSPACLSVAQSRDKTWQG